MSKESERVDYYYGEKIPGMVEKCTSWRGHKFEARFDLGPLSIGSGQSISNASHNMLMVLDKFRDKTYVHDICVRCGKIVKREKNTP